MNILIVDDSVVFRSQIRAALDGQPFVESMSVAGNGKVALQRLAQGSIDLVTLDMEMPEMSGLETIREIRKAKFPVRIIVFSSHTRAGSEQALEALHLGADDFTSKPSGEGLTVANAAERIRLQLLPKVLQFAKPAIAAAHGLIPPAVAAAVPQVQKPAHPQYDHKDLSTFLPAAIVIGCSTGGPPALERILMSLPRPCRVPILIAQHMPPVFTQSLARRLGSLTAMEAGEAVHNAAILPNRIYVAPGDFHFTVKKSGDDVIACLDKNPPRNSVRPSVDPLFETAAKVYGPRCMGVILTGMGEDGLIGCRAIKRASGGVIIQDKATSVVFGMPGAVFHDGCFDEIGPLEKINSVLRRMTT
jgi:two-component system, chemotaxis family, protein-glutamate methylesterase/glutaminase